MKHSFKYIWSLLIVSVGMLSSCNEDEDPIPFTVNFTNTESSISSTASEVEIGITFSRPAEVTGILVLDVGSSGLTYGSESDFYIISESDPGEAFNLPFDLGDESLTFTVASGSALNIQQDQTVTIGVQAPEGGEFVLGEQDEVVITFSENFVAFSGTLELDAGGEAFSKVAFADLSKLATSSVDVYSWDLGFYTGENHQVKLNSHAYIMARMIDKNDLNEVTAEDTLNFGYEMTIPPPNFDPTIGSAAWVDTPDGSLETTAFGEISSTDSENKVFIIKRDNDQPWKKVRILQNGDGYTIQYANISSTSFETAQIDKDESFNYISFDLDQGVVVTAPSKNAWDFSYGTYTEILNFGGLLPYGYKDFIVLNSHSTSISMVMISEFTYEEFVAGDLSTLTFTSEADALGETWRSGGGPTSGPALYEDRFFVLKDAEGNYYKIKFTRLTSTEGERGYPEFTFELL